MLFENESRLSDVTSFDKEFEIEQILRFGRNIDFAKAIKCDDQMKPSCTMRKLIEFSLSSSSRVIGQTKFYDRKIRTRCEL